MSDLEKLENIINSSGFPLQIAIENLVKSTSNLRGWQVLSKEHAWESKVTNKKGFIDLILVDRHYTFYLIIECKRVLDSTWVFLQPSSDQLARRQVKAWVSKIKNSDPIFFGWIDLSADPITPESEFCIVPGQDSKSIPMLERIASDLVDATEAFAHEDLILIKEKREEFRIYFNVIVTTSDLSICSFEPNNISLKDGKIVDGKFSSYPYLRFRKQLSTADVPHDFLRGHPYNEFLQAKENTVFIVNAENLINFLQKFEVDDLSIKRFKF